MGTASPPQNPQPREEILLPRAPLSPVGAVDFSRIQSQRKEIPLPGAGMSAPPLTEIPRPAAASPGEFPPSAPLSAASPCTATPHTASCTRLLQTADIPPETARLVRCHNPWPTEDVIFCPNDALPAFMTGIPVFSSGPELWIAVHNHRPEPLQLHSGQTIGVLEVVTLADSRTTTSPASSRPQTPCHPPLPERLSPLQQQQLNELFREFSDVFSRGENDLGNTPLLEHAIETHGPPLRQPYRLQNPAVRREDMAQVQQMLSSNVIRPSNNPWASLVVMVRKKDGSLRFCVDFRQHNAATVKDAHPLPRIDTSSSPSMGPNGSQLWISRVGTGRCPSQNRTRRRPRFEQATDSCSSSIRSPLVCVTLLPPSPASWIASLPASTGRCAYFTWTTSSSSPPPGRSTSLDFDRSLSDLGTPTLSWEPTRVRLRPKRSTT